MNEQIEYFKKYSECYLRWSHSNMDRIVADIIMRDKEAEEKRKEDLRLAPIRMRMVELFKNSEYQLNKINADYKRNFDFARDVQWGILKLDPAQVLNLKF